MTKLSNSIKDIYEKNRSDQEAEHISNNLISFFKILETIDTRLNNQKSNKAQYENFRSTN